MFTNLGSAPNGAGSLIEKNEMKWKDNSLIYGKEGGKEAMMERIKQGKATEVELGVVGCCVGSGCSSLVPC